MRKKASKLTNEIDRLVREAGRATHEFDRPAQDSDLVVFLIVQGPSKQNLSSVNYRQSTIKFPPRNIVVKILKKIPQKQKQFYWRKKV